MAEVCDRLSLTLADVEQLEISAFTPFLGEKDDMDLIHFEILGLLRPFRNIKVLSVTEASLLLVSGALGLISGELPIVALPELQEIWTGEHVEVAFAEKSFAPFISARNRSLRPVVVRSQCPIPSLSTGTPTNPEQLLRGLRHSPQNCGECSLNTSSEFLILWYSS
jgi:hypothetical protein